MEIENYFFPFLFRDNEKISTKKKSKDVPFHIIQIKSWFICVLVKECLFVWINASKNFLILYCVTILLNLLKRFSSATVFILLKLNVVNLQIGFGSKTIVSYNKRGRTIKDTRRKQFCQLNFLNSGRNVKSYSKIIDKSQYDRINVFKLLIICH